MNKWTAVSIAIGVISLLVSLFPSEIRSYFGAAVRKGGARYRQRSLLRLEIRLNLINYLHENAYGLLIWLFTELRWPVFATAGCLYSWFQYQPDRADPIAHMFGSLTVGLWGGTLLRISRIVELLEKYQLSKTYLEERITKLKEKRTQSTTAHN